MTSKEILKKINEIFQEIFDNENLLIHETTTAKDVDGWDSLVHIRIIVSLEKEFHVKLTIEEMAGINNIRDMAELIQRKI